MSLQICPMDRRLPVSIFGRIWPVWDRADSAVDSGIVTRFIAVIVSLFRRGLLGRF